MKYRPYFDVYAVWTCWGLGVEIDFTEGLIFEFDIGPFLLSVGVTKK